MQFLKTVKKLLKCIFYLLTINACITPGSHPKAVSKRLIKKVTPNPCFKNTAKGGINIFSKIVSNDIMYVFNYF